jgi:hypothetical protein
LNIALKAEIKSLKRRLGELEPDVGTREFQKRNAVEEHKSHHDKVHQITTALILFKCPWLTSYDFDLKLDYYDNDEVMTLDSYRQKDIAKIGYFFGGEFYKEMHREWFRDQVSSPVKNKGALYGRLT